MKPFPSYLCGLLWLMPMPSVAADAKSGPLDREPCYNLLNAQQKGMISIDTMASEFKRIGCYSDPYLRDGYYNNFFATNDPRVMARALLEGASECLLDPEERRGPRPLHYDGKEEDAILSTLCDGARSMSQIDEAALDRVADATTGMCKTLYMVCRFPGSKNKLEDEKQLVRIIEHETNDYVMVQAIGALEKKATKYSLPVLKKVIKNQDGEFRKFTVELAREIVDRVEGRGPTPEQLAKAKAEGDKKLIEKYKQRKARREAEEAARRSLAPSTKEADAGSRPPEKTTRGDETNQGNRRMVFLVGGGLMMIAAGLFLLILRMRRR
ncbi:hypothetical protein HZA56_21535 [Candidatus Poribacteria bacterium]|nr:hypothetical protein [Candidatus Poribacteria bacterium]